MSDPTASVLPTAPAPRPAVPGDERAPRAWIAPTAATVTTLPLAFCAFVFAALSPMACDSCSQAQAASFTPSFMTAFAVFTGGLLLPLGLLLASWLLPWRRRNVARRRRLALLAPASVVVLYGLFLLLVDWP